MEARPAPPAAARVRVWSTAQRTLHIALIAGVAVAWCVGESRQRIHDTAGYVALAAVGLRVLLGFAGGRHARFASFVRGSAAVLRYGRAMLAGREQRYLGHNPLGGWMVVALLSTTGIACVTGVLYTTDALWGLAWLEWLHRAAAWAVLGLAVVHVVAVIAISVRHRENLVAAMLSGDKRIGR
ncbi:cytochrome b [Xenophilus aerolatus]|nr:cytochrome b [Xenophilus aerolatus]